MKALKRLLTLLLALAVFAGVILFAPSASAGDAIKDITLQPGTSESAMNFCWQSSSGGAPVVQLAEYDAASSRFPPDAQRFSGTAAASTKGYYANNVAVTGLKPDTEYIYKVGNGTAMSTVYSFKTQSSSHYSALFVSDAQIGASGSVSTDKAAWEKTLSAALGKFPETGFILSAGDQVDYYLESEYDAFLSSPLLRQYPIAPAVGNHENLSKSPLHSYFYNEPNASAAYGLTPAGGDYWFRYGNTLYIVLNTNNTNTTEHDAFIAQAAASNADARWRILMFHQSIYSSAQYAAASSILTLRKNLTPVIDKYDIDVVLSGHDHCYTRTYQMLGGNAEKTTADSQGRVINPAGTVYITADSSSGSKYYNLKATPEPYAAVRLQPKAPTFTEIDVTDTTLTLMTYRADTLAILDTYAIVKQNPSGFTDVPDGIWYFDAVAYLSNNHITEGTTPTTFSPDMTLTRSQCLVFVMKAYGLAPDTAIAGNFSDAGNTWYTGYLAAAKRLGLVGGSGDNKFMPDVSITRQDMFVVLYNTLVFTDRLPPVAGTPQLYSDDDAIAPYAKKAVDALSSTGIVTGSDGKLSPHGTSTRAQMAQALYKILSR
jgi:hypothetical protein